MYGNAMGVDVIRLLDHLKIEKAHVVGYSMGGRITYKLVADYPDRVISAMPCGAGWGPPSQTRDDLFERLAVSLEKSGSIRPVLDHFVSDGSMTAEEIEQIDARIRESNDTRALAAMARSIPELRPDRAKLEANTVPCMCVIGERDPNRADVDAMLEYMPNLDISVVDGADHMTAFRDPAFIAAITSFIGRHASGSAGDRVSPRAEE